MAVKLKAQDEISTSIAARILGLSPQRIRQMFEARIFKTAHKPGTGSWRVSRIEVNMRKTNNPYATD
jgi:hypothetical protein